jgi:hypothetical protein
LIAVYRNYICPGTPGCNMEVSMKPVYKAEMKVNNKAVEMNEFVEGYIAHISAGIVQSLKGVDYLKKIEMKLEGNDVEIHVNGDDIALTPFPIEIIVSTLKGIIKPLAGTDNAELIQINVDVIKS